MKPLENTARIDKYLWSVRLFKTRSLAADACKNKKILVNDIPVKPSRTIKTGDIFKVKTPPEYREFKVKQALSNRVGAKLVADFLTEITPQEVLDIIKLTNEHTGINRQRGTGRPTKKDRRDLRNYFG